MGLKSFREILLKKCDNVSLHNFIKFSKEEILTKAVLESLKKMSDSRLTGSSGLNAALLNFAKKVKEDEDGHEGVFPSLFHDAVSHHVSHYKAALKHGKQDIANQHARKIFEIMHAGRKIDHNADYKLAISAPHPTPWVSHAYGVHTRDTIDAKNADRKKQGKPPIKAKAGDFITMPKGWNHSSKDYSFLQREPNTHKSNASDIINYQHRDAFPMEKISIAKKHLHISDDLSDKDVLAFTPHEFDSHPVIKMAKKMGRATPDDNREYFDKESKWMNDKYNNWADRHIKMQESDPEKYEARGSTQPSPVHPPTANPLTDEHLSKLGATLNEQKAAQTGKTNKPKMNAEQLMNHFQTTKDLSEEMRTSILGRIKASGNK